jgi:hypothetical protein
MRLQFANAIGAAVVVMTEVWAAPPMANEVLYLADTDAVHDGATNLYVVDWQGVAHNANANKAVLKLLPSGRVSLNHVDAMAASRDGRKLWLIDDGEVATHQLAYYDLSSDTTYLIDFLEGVSDLSGNSIDGAAVAPDGQLYVARSDVNELWIIDTSTAEATLVGTLMDRATNAPIDVQGGDLVLSDDGVMYLWANNNEMGAPRGLYNVEYLNPKEDMVYATHLGGGDASFRGLAMNAGGDILGSDSTTDQILLVAAATGTVQEARKLFDDGWFDHSFGDMAVAPALHCAKTIGYWKNHGWDDATVIVNGEKIDQDRGHQILWDARGRNFSMLFAQLLAAKLNCPECGKTEAIDAAEMFLLSNRITSDNYDEKFLDKEQKQKQAKYWTKLDGFNNQYACDEIEIE